ncbi:hypothetical protein CDD82_102 [Ophiocordyceps australis]|uniref:Uncharacterized protein n=1 Tax=Ophiocordyceps australis TaxID=1399860 RepID=A0A2C5XE23_9HYPO|nr:hypothetical protein CDD82_102 [Ophiocordyceps australis]
MPRKSRATKALRRSRAVRKAHTTTAYAYCMSCFRVSVKQLEGMKDLPLEVPPVSCSYANAGSSRCDECGNKKRTCHQVSPAMVGDRNDFVAISRFLTFLNTLRLFNADTLQEYREWHAAQTQAAVDALATYTTELEGLLAAAEAELVDGEALEQLLLDEVQAENPVRPGIVAYLEKEAEEENLPREPPAFNANTYEGAPMEIGGVFSDMQRQEFVGLWLRVAKSFNVAEEMHRRDHSDTGKPTIKRRNRYFEYTEARRHNLLLHLQLRASLVADEE